MKRLIFFLVFTLSFTGVSTVSFAQADEATQLLLNVEKLTQLKQILSDMKKGYQIISKGYNTIKDLSEGNFSLHKAFLDGLMEVSPTVKKYQKIKVIVDGQLELVKTYKTAFIRFKSAGYFNPGELEYISRVYDNLFKQSLKNLDDLLLVVTADKLRMSDAERLDAIDNISLSMNDMLSFLKNFNHQTTLLTLQRAGEKNDAVAMKKIYGINE